MLIERAAWIPTGDRLLVEAVYGEGLTVAAFVRRCLDRGLDPAPTSRAALGDADFGQRTEGLSRITRRRLRRLVARLGSDRFAFVISRRNTWPVTRRRVAVSCVLHGLSLREASRQLGLSLHTVRRHMEAVDALIGAYADAARQAREAVRAAGQAADGARH